MSIDTISPVDEVVLGLVRNHQVSGYAAVLPNIKPSNPLVAEVRSEVERHAPGYVVLSEYGLYATDKGMQRATRLSMRPTEETVQDAFMDGFEHYFREKYGDASPI